MTREQRPSNLRFWLVVAAICAVGLYAEHWYFNRTAVPSDTETTQSTQQSGLNLQMLTGGMGMPMAGGGMPPGGGGGGPAPGGAQGGNSGTGGSGGTGGQP